LQIYSAANRGLKIDFDWLGEGEGATKSGLFQDHEKTFLADCPQI
jgi:hypothetical protein